ncbi:hypothetical protein ACE5M2_18395 [Clostridioides difficile]|nr:hypothetical protein [Clostridioides difficile]
MNIEEYREIREQHRVKDKERVEEFAELSIEKNDIDTMIKVIEKSSEIKVLDLEIRNSEKWYSLSAEYVEKSKETIGLLKDFLVALKKEAEKQIEEI